MEIISLKENRAKAIREMVKAIEEGKIVIYPTDTVYGIGGNALDEKVVKKVYRIKKRKKDNPLAIIVNGIEMIKTYCRITTGERRKLKKYFPGPYTLLLNKSRKKLPVTKLKRVGVRMPKHSFIERVMEKIEIPLITTSANISGGADPMKLDDVPKEMIEKVDLVIDGGETKFQRPSTIIDLPTGRVLRDFSKR